MNNIHLVGQLKELVGHEYIPSVNVSSINEIVNYLSQYSTEVKPFMLKESLFIAYKNKDNDVLPITFETQIPNDVDICIVEVIEGEIPAAAVAYVLGTSAFWSYVIAFVVNIAIAYALSSMLAPDIQSPDFGGDEAELNNSIYYNGGLNVQNQGAPFPIVYGRCHTNSVVIASQLNTYEGKAA